VQVAAFIKETKGNEISVSLRSKGNRDVAKVARAFGGGGHWNAAGFRVANSTVDEIRDNLLPQLKELLT
jgi:phosphoesterase RecJ-like protein